VKHLHSAPLNALRTFEAAARHLSFNAAARQLFVTPAAVSHQVKQLEAYLGVTLFVRNHRSVELTPEGEALAATLGDLFGRLYLALDRTMSSGVADLRVTTMESFAAKWLTPRLHRFHRAWPDIRVRIDTGNEHADFARGGIDVGIRYGPGGYKGMHVESLMTAQVFPVCSPSLLAGASPPLTHPGDLRHYTLLHDESAMGRSGVPDWADWLQAEDVSGVDASRGPIFASIYLAQEAAVAGHGVALGIAPLVEEDLRCGRLVKLFDRVLDNTYAFWLIRRKETESRAEVEAFCRWLRDEAAADARSDPKTSRVVG
jgi:LysR family transcriptional regulator, glycine cleavage system transcriptional activator